jgi:hypothetical protein
LYLYFFIGQQFRAGQAMNSTPAAIPFRYSQWWEDRSKDDRPTKFKHKDKVQTILTGDQKHTDHFAKGQHHNRHADQRYVFYFFSHRTFLKTILASRTSGTFGFAPTHKASPSAKPKEPLFLYHSYKNLILKSKF